LQLNAGHNAAGNARRPPLSRVPGDSDREAYLVPDDFGGRLGMAWRETADTGLERLIEKLLAGQYTNPARIVTFNTAEG
jgi:hypothetical protein